MNKMKEMYKLASTVQMSSKQKEEQRNSFVYGSTKIENDHITRDLVIRTAQKLGVKGE